MSFHQALDLIFELDKAAVGCTQDILRQRDFLDRLSEIPWVAPTFVVIEGKIEILHDVVGASGYHCGVLQSFPVERIEQGNEPPTPDPEWNTRQVVDDQPEHNNMEYAAKNPLTFDDLVATHIDFYKFAMNRLKIDKLTKAHLVGPVYNILKGTCQSSIELEYNMEECYKALSDQLDWNNPEGDRCPFDLNKPLPLKGRPCHLTVALEYFFNNDLEYLKSSDPEKKYTTSITKTKAARYELVGIEDMIPSLYSVTKIKEGDFVNLHLNDIEDMLLLVVQHKLFQLNGCEIVDLAVALRMFTKSLIIKRRVEDVQLGVESYQKKLNITKPHEDFPGMSIKELIQQRDVRRKWSATDKRRSELMVELIDKQMRERRILRNLERLVGAQELKMDYRLMQRTL
ncbi:hypothetical protein Tco_1329008 [Tanacetum coccineum]